MTRPISTTLKQALTAAETDEVILTLLTIDSSELSSPIRLVQNTENITSRGDVYIACPFRYRWPSEHQDRAPRGRLSIDNIDRSIVQMLRAATIPANATLEIVLASDPDTVETSAPGYRITRADWNAIEVDLDTSQEPFLRARFPKDRFTPGNFPGLFP